MGIFADNAVGYWRAGLSIIPLLKNDKRPAIQGWQKYQSRLATEEELASWIEEFGDGNIGMTLGPASGLIAFDVDTDDPKILAVLEKVLPPSPWTRIGAKGKVWLYKFDGGRTFRVNIGKDRIIDVLSAGTQVVLPPSIHPTTGKEYWQNKPLVEVLGDIVGLPSNIDEVIRDALKEAGFDVTSGRQAMGALTDFVSVGNRDNKLVSIAGMHAHDILKGNITFAEARDRMLAWAEEFTKKVHGDSVDPKKGVAKLVEFLTRDVKVRGRALPKGWDADLTDEDKAALGLDFFSEDDERWSYEQILTTIQAEMDRTDNEERFTALVQASLVRIARNRDITPLQEEHLISFMSALSGKKFTVGALRRELKSLTRGPCRGENHAEIAQAVIKDQEERNGEIRSWEGNLWQWNGSHWDRMDEGELRQFVAVNYGGLPATKRSSDYTGVINDIRDRTRKPLTDRGGLVGINFVNGFLTEDLDLVAHHPDFGMTYTLPYPYEPEGAAKCHKWLEMLSDYWGEDEDYAEKVEALREAMCVTMFGEAPKAQMAFVLYGVAHSGKSRILEIMRALMPEGCAAAIPPTLWADQFAPAEFVGKLLNVAGELSEHQNIDGARFKEIIDGAEISTSKKHQQRFQLRPKCAHWFATNHLPRSRDSSEGFTRRFMIFDFPRKFPVERRVDDYDKVVIAEERAAIAAWIVQGRRGIKANGGRLTDPPSSRRLRERLENQLNSVRSFLSDLQEQGRLLMGVEKTSSVTTSVTLMKDYRSYCVENSVPPVQSKTFEQRMEHLQGVFGFLARKGGSFGMEYKYLTRVEKKVA